MLKRTVQHKLAGEKITFVETATETQGQYLLIEVTFAAKGRWTAFTFSSYFNFKVTKYISGR